VVEMTFLKPIFYVQRWYFLIVVSSIIRSGASSMGASVSQVFKKKL